jgi:hypothetical protein
MKKKATVLEVLREARALIRQGWTKNAAQKRLPNGKILYCIVGALGRVPGATGVTYELAKYELECAGNIPSVIGFNDAHKTTKRQVLALFDKTIKRLIRVGKKA